MQKEGTGYKKVTDVLNMVNNNIDQEYGEFDLVPVNGNNNLVFKTSSFARSGVYKFVISVYDDEGNVISYASKNFIIVE